MSESSISSVTTILVVDDDPSQRMLMTVALERLGMKVVEAGDGIGAIEQFQAHHPTLVLMDIQMPVCDGFEACIEIRKLPGGDDAAIVMMTGSDDFESIDRAYEVGATDFLTKPFNWQILIHRVRYLLRAQQAFVALHQSRKRLAWAQRVANLGNWEMDLRTRIIHCSSEVVRIIKAGEAPMSLPLDELLKFIHSEDQERLFETVGRLYRDREVVDIAHRIVQSDGAIRTIQQRIQRIVGKGGEVIGVTGTMQDVTEQKIVEQRIRQLAYYDNLTGLPNRQNFMETAGRALRNAAAGVENLSLLFVDLDMFKKINDTLGHGAGDDLLRRISDRLSAHLREFTDHRASSWQLDLSRIGGDEFVLLVRGCYSDKEVEELAEAVLASLAEPIVVEGRELYITGSMGLARYPQDGEDLDTLLKHADTAMYRAKQIGRNRFLAYTQTMSAELMEKLSLGGKLQKAIENQELALYYQPQIRTGDGRVMGVEALLRWNHSELGNVPPDTFIPVAEDTGLIEPIGEWVMREACRQAAAWRRNLDLNVKVGVNLSSHQFQNTDLVALIRSMIEEYAVPPHCLEFEITESAIMQSVDEARKILLDLQRLGVQVSIDDFGTGYSSMSYLKSFPLDTLKIDRSFITDVSSDPDSAAIARAIIAMAKQLGLNTIAEGVETLSQFAFLQEQECDQIQGYLVGKPMPAEDAGQFLESFSADGWRLHAESVPQELCLDEPVGNVNPG